MTKTQVDATLISKLRGVLEKKKGLMAAYLFGSRATGESHPDSDVDVAVLFQHRLTLEEIISLESELADAIGLEVDLLDLRRAKPFLALDVLRGIRFLELDPAEADEYELYILRRAGDLAPWERERRAILLRKKS